MSLDFDLSKCPSPIAPLTEAMIFYAGIVIGVPIWTKENMNTVVRRIIFCQRVGWEHTDKPLTETEIRGFVGLKTNGNTLSDRQWEAYCKKRWWDEVRNGTT